MRAYRIIGWSSIYIGETLPEIKPAEQIGRDYDIFPAHSLQHPVTAPRPIAVKGMMVSVRLPATAAYKGSGQH